MAKAQKSKKDSRDIKAEAMKLAAQHKVEGQSKEQTKQMAGAIQKSIEQFLRQQAERSRELDKRLKQVKKQAQQPSPAASDTTEPNSDKAAEESRGLMRWLPWGLLAISWLVFAYLYGQSL